ILLVMAIIKMQILMLTAEDEQGNTLPTVKHAEVVAIDNAHSKGLSTSGATIYVTHQPCNNCLDAIAEANITNIRIVGEFLKFDTDKLRYDLIPVSALEALAKVLTVGAKKYKPNNWLECKEPERYIAALMRHIEAYRAGEWLDDGEGGTGLPHLACAMTNLAFLLELGYKPQIWAPMKLQVE